jgi:hypothetical protein
MPERSQAEKLEPMKDYVSIVEVLVNLRST